MKIDKHLILHLGQHKTGSTSIQRALNKANSTNYYYPKFGKLFSGHHEISKFLNFSEGNDLKYLLDEIKTVKQNTIILSSEFFSSQNELSFNYVRFKKLFESLNLLASNFTKSSIVIFYREQAESIESRINQAIKSKVSLTNVEIEPFFTNKSLDYQFFHQLLHEAFPKSTIYQVLFNKSLSPLKFLVKTFKISGLPEDHISNNKLENLFQVSAFLKVNQLFIDKNKSFEIKNGLKAIDKYLNFPIITKDQCKIIREFYQESNMAFYKLNKCAQFNFTFNGRPSEIAFPETSLNELNRLLLLNNIEVKF